LVIYILKYDKIYKNINEKILPIEKWGKNYKIKSDYKKWC